MSERPGMDDPLETVASDDGFLASVSSAGRNRLGVSSKEQNVGWWACLLANLRLRGKSYLWSLSSRLSYWLPQSYFAWVINSVPNGSIWEQELAVRPGPSDTFIIRVKRRLDYEIGLKVWMSLLPIWILLVLMLSLFVSLLNVSRLSPASPPEKKPQTVGKL